ncbi:MAG: glycosyltransferase family 2 protein [Acidobacteria bacterium]|nr:glycosyltransferase family 2 protein [Acidobacteriota bacterium]
MTLTILIPVYNGSKTIERLVARLIELLNSQALQIVLVNDGSQDDSHQVCLAIAERHPSIVTYVDLARNFGEHNAVMAGLNYMVGDYVVIMDDDFQNPPEDVKALIDTAKTGQFDIVYTYYARKEHSWFRNFGSRFNDLVATFMLEKPRDLYLSSFKCMNRFLVNEIIKYRGPYPYIDGLALRCTRRIGKVQVHHARRAEGRSGYTVRKLVRLWLNMFVNFSVIPLRVSSLLGLIFSALGGVMSLLVVVEKLSHPEIPIGWPSLVVIATTFSGLQLLMLGLIGEYLGRLFLSYNQTPQFVVRDAHNVVERPSRGEHA